mmetsp:Transcript_5423/g.16180  ORF Transcript_5423/g.16180 Transcript_5423/m.16180 type:complete len:220 (+) Transcript_5423:218-877(+)
MTGGLLTTLTPFGTRTRSETVPFTVTLTQPSPAIATSAADSSQLLPVTLMSTDSHSNLSSSSSFSPSGGVRSRPACFRTYASARSVAQGTTCMPAEQNQLQRAGGPSTWSTLPRPPKSRDCPFEKRNPHVDMLLEGVTSLSSSGLNIVVTLSRRTTPGVSYTYLPSPVAMGTIPSVVPGTTLVVVCRLRRKRSDFPRCHPVVRRRLMNELFPVLAAPTT